MEHSENVRIVLCGAGHRAVEVASLLCTQSERFAVTHVVDPSPDRARVAAAFPHRKIAYTKPDDELPDDVDLVIIGCSNAHHFFYLEYYGPRPQKIFCEKPVVTTEEHLCRLLAWPPREVFTGFVLRHAPPFAKVRELIEDGVVGKPISVFVRETLHMGHGAFINQDWRRFKDESGGHVVEKGIHLLDLMAWYAGSEARCVQGLGDNTVWTEENGRENREWLNDTVPGCMKQYRSPGKGTDAFDSKKDIEAVMSITVMFRNNVIGSLQMVTYALNSTRSIVVHCTRGEIRLHWEEDTTVVTVLEQPIGKKANSGRPSERRVFTWAGTGCHGGGDRHIATSLLDHVLNGTPASPPFSEALHATSIAISAEQAMIHAHTAVVRY